MLLARVAAELRTDGDLSEQFLPIRFMEESQEVFNLGDFWLELLFYLARVHGVRDPDLSRELRDVHAALAAEWRGRELEERARAAVLEIADRLGKQFVLMVENLQSLCRDVDQDFGWKLRGVLQSEPQIILLATATSRFVELDDAKHAFFELFRIMRLEPLDTCECRRLWQMVTGDDVREPVIRPLQILTGGDPRLLVIIGEFAQHQSLRQLMEDLVRLIDDHTEYFRAHLEGFAKTERRVYLALIDLWRPSTTGEIAARARLDVRTVSTLLGRLVGRGAVIVEGNGGKRVYAAAQRLYSIYYKLRRERDEATVVRNLIHFMAVLYSDDEPARRIAERLTWEAVQSPTIREGIERAIAEAPHIGRFFSHEEWQTISQASERATAMDDKDAMLSLRGIVAEIDETENGQVIEIMARGRASPIENSPHAPEPVTALALWRRAFAHGNLGEYEAAIAIYDQLVAYIGDSDVPELQVLVAKSLVNRAEMETRLGCAEEALHTCEEFERRVDVLAGIEKGALERRSRWVRTRALFFLERHTAAVDLFRSVYAAFVPSEKTMVGEMLAQVPNLIAAGASERDLVAVLSSDNEKANKLVPLVVALRQRAGEVVREPAEVLEIATDIHRLIETKLGNRRRRLP